MVIVLTPPKTEKRPIHREHHGDVVLAVGETSVDDLSDFYTAVWALGAAGVSVPLTLDREGDVFDVELTSTDRRKLLKKPRFH